MQQNSFFMGRNYSKYDITDAKTGWSLCPVQDMDKVLTNRYVDDDAFSLFYCDLYLRELKETLKHTMLVHESVFESQVHELHRLYWKQKELMMEMEETRHHEEDIEDRLLVDNKVEKFEKKVLDLDLKGFECNDMNGEEVHETQNQSLRRMCLESNKFQFDLNEPANLDSDLEFNQFLSSVASNEIGGESGIDLNMSPFSSKEEVTIVKKFETEKPKESLSISLLGKDESEQPRPSSTSSLGSDKRMRISRLRKKVKGSDLAQATSESQGNQASKEKGSSSSLFKAKPARNRTKLDKTRRCNGHKVVKRKKKSRKISLVTEGNAQEVSAAAEAIVDISRKSDSLTSLGRNLLWFAEISSSIDEDKTNLRVKSSDNKTAVSKIVQRRSQTRNKSSPPKPMEAFIISSIKKRRRGSRIPATDFKRMIIDLIQ